MDNCSDIAPLYHTNLFLEKYYLIEQLLSEARIILNDGKGVLVLILTVIL